jgi:2'-5' RNA ligase
LSSAPERVRLFFALWPAEALAVDLAALASRLQPVCGGRPMRAETLHLTLAFLGELPVEREADACAAAAEVSLPAFEFRLDQIGYWRHNGVVWTAVRSAALDHLAADLGARLRAAGFVLERRPFAAHVTLLRRAERAPDEAVPIIAAAWPVTEFLLVRSPGAAGGGYRPVGRWVLT